MRGFKVGDKVVIIELLDNYPGNLKVGDIATIGEVSKRAQTVKMVCDAEISCTWQFEFNIKHAEKWSIYNNTLPWSELSDKQKGKLLLANINDVAICMVAKSLRGDETFINNVEIDKGDVCVYRAQPKPVKPEPTMEELFHSDFYDLKAGSVAIQMIAKGWTKPC
jgi:hypothetical protein